MIHPQLLSYCSGSLSITLRDLLLVGYSLDLQKCYWGCHNWISWVTAVASMHPTDGQQQSGKSWFPPCVSASSHAADWIMNADHISGIWLEG